MHPLFDLTGKVAIVTGSTPRQRLGERGRACGRRGRPAIIDPEGFGALLRAIDGHNGTPEVRLGPHLRPAGRIARRDMVGDRLRPSHLDDPTRAHEDAPSPSHPAGPPDPKCPEKRPRHQSRRFALLTPERSFGKIGLQRLRLVLQPLVPFEPCGYRRHQRDGRGSVLGQRLMPGLGSTISTIVRTTSAGV